MENIVTRLCCTSGHCYRCHQDNRTGKPSRILHMVCQSKEQAETVAKNWKNYEAKAETRG